MFNSRIWKKLYFISFDFGRMYRFLHSTVIGIPMDRGHV
jgi:hypothetical protein